ncbi:hypothetical protein VDR21_21405, partial [Xanthomonas campestris pv. campestris]|nr:hypothetical protein [Xanthomonas campestris pv. campestris]MEB1865946.1 hypothetical protein [Xanthomonas campestris pv. campestris]
SSSCPSSWVHGLYSFSWYGSVGAGHLHNAALACEKVVDLLKKKMPNTLGENQEWSKALGAAQFELTESYRSAFAVAAEFDSVPMFKRARSWMTNIRMTTIRKKANPRYASKD